ncbi:MAG: septum formation protein Maf [Desulfuromonas sp.]|nr:MAG: septum formation protein Maf [Desulfuromonas sp.]
MRKIVLASTSPYRRNLLRQLEIPFVVSSPLYVEKLDQGVAPELLVKHLSFCKAESLQKHFPDSLIIGADQVFVDPRSRVLGKPAGREEAILQLKAMVGQRHTFYTGVTVFDAETGEAASDYSEYSVTLRQLSDQQIASYVDRESPYDCAGAFRVEGLGITLMEKMEGEDYNSLIGLPLIKLTALLERFGIEIL